LAGPEYLPYYTWQLPLNYAAYDAIDDNPIDKDHNIGIPLDRLLYSPSGSWGVQLPDLYAAIGGSPNFVSQFKQVYPTWRRDAHRFVKSRSQAKERGVDMTWAKTLLQHAYGPSAPQF
jgi:hypothetical protein